MRRKIPPLNALAVFEAVARSGNIGQAADSLGVTHSAVGHQIRGLESWMDVPLFQKKGRHLMLSRHGQRLAKALTSSFDAIESCVAELAQPDAEQRTLKVASSTAIASTALPGYAAEFMRTHGLAEFNWVPLEDMNDDVDLIITWKPAEISGDVETVQVSVTYFMVCGPELLHVPLPRRLDDLSEHTLIHGDQDGADWTRFLSLLGRSDITPKANMYLGNIFVAHQAARNGCGIAIGDEIMVDGDLRKGTLIRPLLDSVPSPAPIRIISPFRSRNNALAKDFKRWFLEKVSHLPTSI